MSNFNNERGTELIWLGKYNGEGKLNLPEKVSWPFQTIETVNESKIDREKQRNLFFQKKEQSVWKNRLIWGDNKYIMSSLLEEFAGKIDLIYIDPPFATGADFSYKVNVGDAELEKEPSMIEEIAYRDTWGKGMDSFIQMMYERLILMKNLLSEKGSIYIHLDSRTTHYIKIIMDEIFCRDNFLSEITWKRTTARSGSKSFNNVSDYILVYKKSENFIWNKQYSQYSEEYIKNMFRNCDVNGRKFRESPLTAPGRTNGQSGHDWKGIDPGKIGKGRHWSIPGFVLEELSETAKNDTLLALKELDKIGRIVWSKNGIPNLKQFEDELSGVELQNIWTDIGLDKSIYPTQKPVALLERIIKASSNQGDLVSDFFCGSGTTGAVAEKLGRRWILADLSRFAIQTTRKRLLQIENCSPFMIQNLGKYERQYWYSTFGSEGINKRQDYIDTILKFYKAQEVTGYQNIHGTKNNRVVFVGELDIPVTLTQIEEVVKECLSAKQTKVDILGWEFEMGLDREIQEIKKKSSIDIRLLLIPKEVMDPKYEGKVDFYDLGVLDLEANALKRNVEIEIKKFYIPHLELVKEEEIREKIKNWSDFIDYYAVDWNYRDDTFHNEWQDFRTKKDTKINLKANSKDSAEDKTTYYQIPGKYKILVKVLDIFGNDTTKIIEVEIK